MWLGGGTKSPPPDFTGNERLHHKVYGGFGFPVLISLRSCVWLFQSSKCNLKHVNKPETDQNTCWEPQELFRDVKRGWLRPPLNWFSVRPVYERQNPCSCDDGNQGKDWLTRHKMVGTAMLACVGQSAWRCVSMSGTSYTRETEARRPQES